MLVLSINVTSGIIEFDKMTHKGGDRASRNTMSQNWNVVVAIVTEGDNEIFLRRRLLLLGIL